MTPNEEVWRLQPFDVRSRRSEGTSTPRPPFKSRRLIYFSPTPLHSGGNRHTHRTLRRLSDPKGRHWRVTGKRSRTHSSPSTSPPSPETQCRYSTQGLVCLGRYRRTDHRPRNPKTFSKDFPTGPRGRKPGRLLKHLWIKKHNGGKDGVGEFDE